MEEPGIHVNQEKEQKAIVDIIHSLKREKTYLALLVGAATACGDHWYVHFSTWREREQILKSMICLPCEQSVVLLLDPMSKTRISSIHRGVRKKLKTPHCCSD